MYDYSRVESYLDDFVNYEVLPGFGFATAGYTLDHVQRVLSELGDPHVGPYTVHVAGSKGKGSVCAMVASALTACGYRTGRYTSPHLFHIGERIVVDEAVVTPEELSSSLEEARPVLEATLSDPGRRRLTYFEVLTILAFLYFRSRHVDAQVVEVGLGGRLDATNVVRPDVCVVTPISLEHTEVLGDSIEKIACEKAGIIKHGATVVAGPQPEAAMRVIEQISEERHAYLSRVGHDVTWRIVESGLDWQSVAISTARQNYAVHLPLGGEYQAENAATALLGLQALTGRGVVIDRSCMVEGFRRVRWPGRFQVVGCEPTLVLDGAHNPASMKRLVRSIRDLPRTGPLVCVLGFSSDKDIHGAVAELGQLAPELVLTRSSQSRAARLEDVASRVADLGLQVQCVAEPCEAVRRARDMAGKGGVVCVAGSLYLLAEILPRAENE